jgi:ABC-2 type transport system permease protein
MSRARTWGLWLWAANAFAFVVLVNLASQRLFFRWDLTEEKKYSIQPATRTILQSLGQPVFVEVFLAGDLNAGFTRLQKSVRETLREFEVYSHHQVQFVFTDPLQAKSQQAQAEFMQSLAEYGIKPINIVENKNGQRSERLAFPGATITMNGVVAGVNLLKGNRALNSQQVLNQSVEVIEFELINAIYKLANEQPRKILWLTGQGEATDAAVAGFTGALEAQYLLESVRLPDVNELPAGDLLIVAKPTKPFSEVDVFKLDQYLMRGGKILWLVDALDASMDSVAFENYFAMPMTLGLESAFFKYGFRINPDLVQDRFAAMYPIVTGIVNGRPQMQPIPWPFFPLVNNYADHPITRNLDAVYTRFISSIDTVKSVGIKKTALFGSTPYSRKLAAPVKISANDLRKSPPDSSFRQGVIPMAYLLEGQFTSVFKNRFLPAGTNATNFVPESVPTKMVVIADGDIFSNPVKDGKPQPLGQDPFADYVFANEELALNIVAYLTDEKGLIQARSKQIKMRPLDPTKVRADGFFWQTVNLVAPIALWLVVGLVFHFVRKRKYASFPTEQV